MKQRILDKVLNQIGEDHLKLMRKYEVIIAGGAITSAYTHTAINDVDCYFKSEEMLLGFLKELEAEKDSYYDPIVYLNHFSEKATLVHDLEGCSLVQYVYQKYYKTAQDIFDNFDFTINMGAIVLGADPEQDVVVLHPQFEEHNLSRSLVVNTKSQYPLVSMFRTNKYKERGYSLSNKELLKMMLMINNLKMESWEDVEEHFSGFYGSLITSSTTKELEFSTENLLKAVEGGEGGDGLYITIGGDYTKPNVYSLETLVEWLESGQEG